MENTGARSGLTRRVVRSDKRGRVELGGLAHQGNAKYLVTQVPDGTVVLIPADDWTDEDLDLILHPDVQELLKPGGRPVFESPTDPTLESDTSELACLAMRQAGVWGTPAFDVDIDHPLFEKAVEAAESAGPNEQRAFDAAQAALEGKEIVDHSPAPDPGAGLPPTISAVSYGASLSVSPFAAALLKEVSQAWRAAPSDAEEVTVEAAISPDGHLVPESESRSSHCVLFLSMKMIQPDDPPERSWHNLLSGLLFDSEKLTSSDRPKASHR